ncbi:unnamed protein product [Rotaria sp. Silwood2]|nr:unnamed protein product [Rotaria sp. Silwood2]
MNNFFLYEGEIYWSAMDTVPELLGPTRSSNDNHPNSIPDALRQAFLNGSTYPIDDGITHGNDALTLLENRSTYTLFIYRFYRFHSFLKQHLNEYNANEIILMTFIMQKAPICFQQKKLSIERNRLQQKEFEEKVSNSLKEEQQLKEKLNLLTSNNKQLKEQVSYFIFI